MLDPYMQQSNGYMHMSPWQGFTANPGMMSGGPQGYMNPSSNFNMQNMYGGGQSSTWSSPYSPMYDNPFTSSFMMGRTNLLSKPAGAHGATFQAHMANLREGSTAAMASTGMEIGGGFAGSALGAMIGQAMIPIPGIGALVGSMVGSMAGGGIGGSLGEMYSQRAGRQLETHRSLMGLANTDSPYGADFGYSISDSKKVYSSMEESATEDPYFSVGEITRIMDEGIKTGNISGAQGTGDITSKIKDLKGVAKSLVEIFGGSDISEIMDTLRRLNGTGLSNGAAVEASRSVGSAARKYGMDASNLMGNLLQEAEANDPINVLSKADAVMSKSTMMDMIKLDPELQKKLGNNEEQIQAIDQANKAYNTFASGPTAQLAFSKNMAASENVYGALAIGEAYTSAGGRKAFEKMSSEDQDSLIQKSFEKVKKGHKNGEFTLGELLDTYSKNGALTTTETASILMQDPAAMKKMTEGYSRALHDSGSWDAVKTQIGYMAKVTQDRNLVRASGMTLSSKTRAIFSAAGNGGYESVMKSVEKAKKLEQRSAAIDSGSFEKQWESGLTAVRKVFGGFIEGLLQDVKKLTSNGVSVGTVTEAGKKAATGIAGNSLEFAKVNAKMDSASDDGYKDMLGTGNREASFTNYLPGLSTQYEDERKNLQSLGTRAGINRQDIGKGMLGAFEAVGWDALTEAVGAFGFATVDHKEVAAMAKSSNDMQRAESNARTKNTNAFADYRSGKIDFETFSEKIQAGNDEVVSNMDLFFSTLKDNDFKDAGATLNNKKFKPTREAAVFSMYQAASAERGEHDGMANKFYDFWGMGDKINAKSEDVIRDTTTMVKSATKAQKAIISAADAEKDIDYGKLQESTSKYGEKEGIEKFIASDPKLSKLGSQAKGFLSDALLYGKGTHKGAVDSFEAAHIKAESLKHAGVDIRAAAAAFNIGYNGNATKQEVETLGIDMTKTYEKPTYKNLMRSLHMDDQEAQDTSKAVGRTITKNADNLAVGDAMDSDYISSLYLDSMKGTKGNIAADILKDGDASVAAVKWTQLGEEDRTKIFSLAKKRAKNIHGKSNSKLADQGILNDTQDEYEKLSTEQKKMVDSLSGIKALGDISEKDFKNSTIGAVTIGLENARNRHLFGENLLSSEKQASAMGVAGLFHVGEKGKMTRMSGAEIRKKYDAIGEKKYEDMTMTERVLSRAMENITGGDKKKEAGVTGEELLTQSFADRGSSGITAKTIEDRSVNKGQNPIENILNQINSKMADLVRNTDKGKGSSTKSIAETDFTASVNKVYSLSQKIKEDSAKTMTPVSRDASDEPVVPPKRATVKKTPVAEPVASDTDKKDAIKTSDRHTTKGKKVEVDHVGNSKKNEWATMNNDKDRPTPASKPTQTVKNTSVDHQAKPPKNMGMADPKDNVPMPSGRRDMSKVGGVRKGAVLTFGGTSLDGLKDDTSDMLLRTKNALSKKGKTLLLTGGSEQNEERHKKGKAFDMSIAQFKDAKEAKKFGESIQRDLQGQYAGGVKVTAKKDRLSISFYNDKKDGGYSEEKDAYTAGGYGKGKDVRKLKMAMLGDKNDIDESGTSIGARKAEDAKRTAELAAEMKVASDKLDVAKKNAKPRGTKYESKDRVIYKGEKFTPKYIQRRSKSKRSEVDSYGIGSGEGSSGHKNVSNTEVEHNKDIRTLAKKALRASMGPSIDSKEWIKDHPNDNYEINTGDKEVIGSAESQARFISPGQMSKEKGDHFGVEIGRIKAFANAEGYYPDGTKAMGNYREAFGLPEPKDDGFGVVTGRTKAFANAEGYYPDGTKAKADYRAAFGLPPRDGGSPDADIETSEKNKKGVDSKALDGPDKARIPKHLASADFNVTPPVGEDFHINRTMNKITKDTSVMSRSRTEKGVSKDNTQSILERIAVATEAVRDALNKPGPDIKKT